MVFIIMAELKNNDEKYLSDNHPVVLALKNRMNSMSPFNDYYLPRHYYNDEDEGLDFNFYFSVKRIRMWWDKHEFFTGTVYILIKRATVGNDESLEVLKYLDDIPEEVITDFEDYLLDGLDNWIPNIDIDLTFSFS